MNQNITNDKPIAAPHFVNPSLPTTDFIWKIIIIGITFVLIASFVVIAVAIFLKVDMGLIQILLTVFTATMTFVAGLLIKSPIQPAN